MKNGNTPKHIDWSHVTTINKKKELLHNFDCMISNLDQLFEANPCKRTATPLAEMRRQRQSLARYETLEENKQVAKRLLGYINTMNTYEI